jgi:hypothetical protein
MNKQSTLDKAATPQRLEIMNNEAQKSTYSLLVNSEEKGRGILEAVVYASCVLSVAAAILQFVNQPTPDPFAGWEPSTQHAPVVSHRSVEVGLETKS